MVMYLIYPTLRVGNSLHYHDCIGPAQCVLSGFIYMIYGLNLVESITLHDITLHYAESSRAEGFFNCEPLSIFPLTTLKYFCIYNGDQSFFNLK